MIPRIKHLKSFATELDKVDKVNEIINALNELIAEHNGQSIPDDPIDRDDYRGVVVTINP